MVGDIFGCLVLIGLMFGVPIAFYISYKREQSRREEDDA